MLFRSVRGRNSDAPYRLNPPRQRRSLSCVVGQYHKRMAYEFYIFPAEGAPGVPPQTVVEAFGRAGIRCIEQPDDYGHWLVLEGYESALDLTIEDGVATYAGFRYTSEDDEAVVQKITDVFKSIGWRVSDGEGML